uniref:Uncharacterized protein n=1 Tax=Arundo donax TaxID=35708 RepID=A0A0A9DPM6_ARUDO
MAVLSLASFGRHGFPWFCTAWPGRAPWRCSAGEVDAAVVYGAARRDYRAWNFCTRTTRRGCPVDPDLVGEDAPATSPKMACLCLLCVPLRNKGKQAREKVKHEKRIGIGSSWC